MAPTKARWDPPEVRIGRRLTRTDRALLRRAGLDATVLAGMSQPRRGQYLRMLREMAFLFALSPQQRSARIRWLKEELPKLFGSKRFPVEPDELGATDRATLSRIFLRMLQRVELKKTYGSVAELKRAAGGFRSTPLGELFELLTDHLRALRKLFRRMFADAVAELNLYLQHAPHLLRNGRGQPVTVKGVFSGRMLVARDFWIKLKGRKPEKYIDRAHLSPLEELPGQPKHAQEYFGLAITKEIKTRESAKKDLRKQIAEILPRLTAPDVEYVECFIDGRGWVKLKPEQLIFSTRIRHTGVTHPEASAAPVAAWRPIDSTEAYLHYEVQVDISKAKFLVELLFPLGSRKKSN